MPAGSSSEGSGSSSDEEWGKEGSGSAAALADASNGRGTARALAARAAERGEELERQRRLTKRLQQSHAEQAAELREAREELRQLRFQAPRAERELEESFASARADKAALHKRLAHAEEGAAAAARELRALVGCLAESPPAAAASCARHASNAALALGHAELAAALQECVGDGAPAAAEAAARPEPASAERPDPRREPATPGGEDGAEERSKYELAALESSELVHSYRSALLKERQRSAALQRRVQTAEAEADELRRARAADAHAHPFQSEVATLKQLAAEATQQAEQVIASHNGSGGERGAADGLRRVLERASPSKGGDEGGKWRRRLEQSQSLVEEQQCRLRELQQSLAERDAAMEEQRRDLQVALSMVRTARARAISCRRTQLDRLGTPQVVRRAASSPPSDPAGATPTRSAAKWMAGSEKKGDADADLTPRYLGQFRESRLAHAEEGAAAAARELRALQGRGQ